MVSSEPLNHVQPNFVWWCIIMSWSAMQRDLFANFNVKVYIIKLSVFTVSSELLADPLATRQFDYTSLYSLSGIWK